ncbi:MAG: hypothetical protein ACHQLQ_13815 [Candidatus Acidiferrales bacterium]
MLKKNPMWLTVILTVAILVAGYSWLEKRVRVRKSTEALVVEFNAQRDALNSFGDVDLNTTNLNLAILEEKLHKPTFRKAGEHDSTTLGWACANKNCAILASFATPFGQEIPATASPVALAVMKPFSSITHSMAIDGVHVGSTGEEIEKICEKRGYGVSLGKSRITCDEGWSVGWVEVNGRVDVLSFGNEKLLSGDKSKVNKISSSQVSTYKRDAK